MSVATDAAIAEAVRNARPSSKGWIRANCPMCELRVGSVDKKRSLGLSVISLWWQCYRCEARGKMGTPLEEWSHLLNGEIAKDKVRIEPPEAFHLLDESTWNSPVLSAAWDYLLTPQPKGRGLTFDEIVNNSLGACVAGRFAGRVIVPIFDARGWAWFVGRAWFKAERPYLYPVGDRCGVMWGQEALLEETDEPVLVVEGCFDAIPYAPDAVAALGKVTDERVLKSLLVAKRPVVLVPDGDEWHAGEAAALRLRLAGLRAGSVRLEPKEDPDQMWPRSRLRELARKSVSGSFQ